MKLRGARTIITGGSRGIGKSIANSFLKEGARVMLVARSADELKDTTDEFKKQFKSVTMYAADVSDASQAKSIVQKTIEEFGGVDVVVNAAGIYGSIGPVFSVDPEVWRKTFEINVFGTFYMIQSTVEYMIKQKKGKIINFSGGGDGPLPRFSAYSASKAAVARLTETLAAELKEYGIDINCIAPGPVNTRLLDEALAAGEDMVGKEKYEVLLKQKSEGGVSPEKTAEICLFLASDVSNGLTGKFLSAVWDKYSEWDKEEIEKISRSDAFTLRRTKWEK
ncbi:SDR family oxidoreductase [Candidatus Peregrinibacteria bacterium]|nr:SDR family oxidoreductase [Candidatus Peregrinibacteria bacterium]MBI5733014.1 SDR family oxidoreductase [Candidatus Jorgensenbacteria bacterium]